MLNAFISPFKVNAFSQGGDHGSLFLKMTTTLYVISAIMFLGVFYSICMSSGFVRQERINLLLAMLWRSLGSGLGAGVGFGLYGVIGAFVGGVIGCTVVCTMSV
jgi:hypothetical protein